MTDLVCEQCGWVEAGFDNQTEIADYMKETELIETHFSDHDCPNCDAEESLEIYYNMCMDCREAEPDCTCEIETQELSEQESEKFREEIFSHLKDKIESTDMQKEQERLKFKEEDLRRIASRLIENHFSA